MIDAVASDLHAGGRHLLKLAGRYVELSGTGKFRLQLLLDAIQRLFSMLVRDEVIQFALECDRVGFIVKAAVSPVLELTDVRIHEHFVGQDLPGGSEARSSATARGKQVDS